MSLASLPRLLRNEPALTQAIGSASGLVAVPERARALSIAALAQLSATAARWWSPARPAPTPASCTTTSRSSCPTARWCCSPRGRRCRSSGSARAWRRWAAGWRCCGGCASPTARPAIVVAGVRALLQRLGPGADDDRAGARPPRAPSSTPTSCCARSSHFGYRREELVEHRGEVAKRGAIIDVFPSHRRRADPHRPVGRRGRPAHRVRRQRPAQHRRPRRGAASSRPAS